MAMTLTLPQQSELSLEAGPQEVDSHSLLAACEGTRDTLGEKSQDQSTSSNETRSVTPLASFVGATHKPQSLSFEDWQALSEIVFEWADSYDNKDWDRLSKILAPRLLIDYSIVGHDQRDNIPASEYLEMMKSPMFLGDPLIKTQHLMGASRYERISDTEAVGHHQIRAAHQRYKPDGVTVENRGHGHSFVKHWYRKVDDVWRLSGLRPEVYWNEHSFDKIFLKLSAAA